MFSGPFEESIIKKAQENGFVTLKFINIRDFGIGTHKTVDDTPYGGGKGMLMRVDVVHEAIKSARMTEAKNEKVYLMSAQGKIFTQSFAKELATIDHLILLCGHYEGIDSRILDYIDGEISIGDFVLTGGELPAMLIIDSVTRLIPGVLDPEATHHESFSSTDAGDLLEYPQFTRPVEYEGKAVPEVLKSGNHQAIAAWRTEQAKIVTEKNRPDLQFQPKADQPLAEITNT
jgi:tRNA (guanine37-N1)-methyltransferase